MLSVRWRVAAGLLVLITTLAVLVAPAFADDGSRSLLATLTAMTTQTNHARTALQAGDTAAARADGRALEASWRTIEASVAQRAPRAESLVDQALDQANAALDANPPPAETAARLEQLNSALVSLIRALQTGATPAGSAGQASLAEAVQTLRAADEALRNGNRRLARQEFQTFQQRWPDLESQVAVRSPSAYERIEARLTTVEGALADPTSDPSAVHQQVGQILDELQSLAHQDNQYGPFDAAITLLREGLEALLVIGALLALVTRAGRPDLRWQVWAGAGFGMLASLAVAVFLQVVLSRLALSLNREVLEGVTGLGAAAMLLYVSYWLHQQGNLADWRRFLATRTGAALTSGETLVLPLLAFLAVFREGAETILLYAGMVAAISTRDLLLGMAIGVAGLTVLGIALFGFGVRLSLKPFFRAISVLLYYLAFKFVGTGVHALQVAGVLPVSSADYLPSIAPIGVFPTWQTTLAQAFLIGAAVVAVGWLSLVSRSARKATTR